jgi:hypothetical protein
MNVFTLIAPFLINMSDFPYFNEYFYINRSFFQLKSKLTSLLGQNYFEFPVEIAAREDRVDLALRRSPRATVGGR